MFRVSLNSEEARQLNQLGLVLSDSEEETADSVCVYTLSILASECVCV